MRPTGSRPSSDITAPYNAPAPGQTPTMDGFVTDYISFFTAEMGRQPTYEEYAQIMTGFTPEQVPVLNGLARGFGVFDHWFCEVPSQTLPNRSFWTAATSSGYTWNSPAKKFITDNEAETIFNRLDDHGKTWKVYVSPALGGSPGTDVIHFPRLQDRFATHFVPFSQFETDAANGDLPDFSFIEPAFAIGHNDYHPAVGRAMGHGVVMPGVDPPSSILGGEEFLSRIYDRLPGDAVRRRAPPCGTRRCSSAGTSRAARMTMSRRRRCRDRMRRPRPASWASRSTGPATGSRRSSCRRGSPKATVFNEEYRHTSLIATLREQWKLGDLFTAHDAAARTFSNVFTLDTPRDPDTWPVPKGAAGATDATGHGRTRRGASPSSARPCSRGSATYAAEHKLEIDGLPKDPKADIPARRRCRRAPRVLRKLLPAAEHHHCEPSTPPALNRRQSCTSPRLT